jgi:uncharacterized SAM-binding protein YcdF (DUF218 family)
MRNRVYNIFYINKNLKNIIKKYILFIFASIIILIISNAFNIYLFSHSDEIINADAAVILGASVWNNRPSPVFKERINHGIWLYKNGYVKYLIFTGGNGKNSLFSESSVARDYAIKNSIPADKIFIEEYSRITFENLIYAKEIIEQNNFNKIIIVSDPLHMKRAITMAKDINLNVYSSPTKTTRYISIKTKLLFLFYELFFYTIYKIYKYSFDIFLYLILFEIIFFIYYYNNFRQNCA